MLQQKKISGNILIKTGLHIGLGDTGVQIGGVDSLIIKNSINQKPYIPGSSLKGKMRFLLEHKYGVAILNSGDIPKYMRSAK